MENVNRLVQADIFFFISSVGFIIIGALFIIALVYVIRVVRDVRDIVAKIKEESENVVSDLRSIRHSLSSTSGKIAGLVSSFILNKTRSVKKKFKKKKGSKDD